MSWIVKWPRQEKTPSDIERKKREKENKAAEQAQKNPKFSKTGKIVLGIVAVILIAVIIIIVGTIVSHKNNTEQSHNLTLTYGTETVSHDKTVGVMQGDVIHVSAEPIGDGEYATEFVYFWDDEGRQTVKAENGSADIIIPKFSIVGSIHELRVAAYYGKSGVYSDGNVHLKNLETYSFQLESEVSITVALNDIILEDGKRYNVKGGETISLSASSVDGIAFISYYFSEVVDGKMVDNIENRCRIYDNTATIQVPNREKNSKLVLSVEPVSRKDDGTNNVITKTGWQNYVLLYGDDADQGSSLYADDIYVFGSDFNITPDSKLKICAYPSDEVEYIYYGWESYDEVGHKVEDSAAEFTLPEGCNAGDDITLAYTVKYTNGTSLVPVETVFHIVSSNTENLNGYYSVTYDNGDKYEGYFVDGKRNGQGALTWVGGDVYTGEWLDGKYNGQGTYTWADGDVYEGEWTDGKRNGQGTMTYTSGSVYEGEYADDQKNGQGTMTWASTGVYYSGTFLNNSISGYGTFHPKYNDPVSNVWTWVSDREETISGYTGRYTGMMANDQLNGYGTFVYEKSGECKGVTITIEGEFIDGKLNGYYKRTQEVDGEVILSSGGRPVFDERFEKATVENGVEKNDLNNVYVSYN